MPTPGNEDFSARYYYDVPVHYHRTLVPRESQLASMVATFEYGPAFPGEERPSSSSPRRDVFREPRTPFSQGNAAWVGVPEFLHPVFRFYVPAGVKLKRNPSRIHDVKRSSWGTNLYVDPFFVRWAFTRPSYDSMESAYEGDNVTVIEYHMVEDFNTDWTAANKWSGFKYAPAPFPRAPSVPHRLHLLAQRVHEPLRPRPVRRRRPAVSYVGRAARRHPGRWKARVLLTPIKCSIRTQQSAPRGARTRARRVTGPQRPASWRSSCPAATRRPPRWACRRRPRLVSPCCPARCCTASSPGPPPRPPRWRR